MTARASRRSTVAGTVKPLDARHGGRAAARQRAAAGRRSAQTTTGADGRVHARGRPSPARTAPGSRRRRASPRASRARSSSGDARSRSCSSPRRCWRRRPTPPATRSAPRPRPTCRALPRGRCPDAESLAPIPALVVERASPPRLRDLPGAAYVERLGSRRPAYVPNDPLAPKQWHLEFNRDLRLLGRRRRSLPAVRVAVIDSGIDGDHPDFAGKIADAKSFVGGSAARRQRGPRHVRRRADRGRRRQHGRDRRRSRRRPSCSSRRSSTATT